MLVDEMVDQSAWMLFDQFAQSRSQGGKLGTVQQLHVMSFQ